MGSPINPNKFEETLKKHHDARLVAFVQAETSTGVLSDAKQLAEISHHHDCLTIVDTVSSLGGSPLKVNEWGKVQSWFLDLNLVMGYWGFGQARLSTHGPDQYLKYGWHEAPALLQEDG